MLSGFAGETIAFECPKNLITEHTDLCYSSLDMDVLGMCPPLSLAFWALHSYVIRGNCKVEPWTWPKGIDLFP